MDSLDKAKKYLIRLLPGSLLSLYRIIRANVIGTLFNYNLNKLANLYGTDKGGFHFYTEHYQTHFRRFKYKRIKLLEIGVGGYENPNEGGNSLRMWKKYFPFGMIFSIDIYDKTPLQENRIKIFQGSQVDKEFLQGVMDKIGGLDIIIDDASHRNEHVIKTFEILFPYLRDGGIYVVEDTETSYRDEMGGDSQELSNPKTTMNFFKSFPDRINHLEFEISTSQKKDYDQNIYSVHFYHNLIIIYKKRNLEKSSNFRKFR